MSTKAAKKTAKKSSKSPNKGIKAWFTPAAPREPSTLNDTKTAILVVSLTINAAFFIAWIALRITDVYDAQVADILFSR